MKRSLFVCAIVVSLASLAAYGEVIEIKEAGETWIELDFPSPANADLHVPTAHLIAPDDGSRLTRKATKTTRYPRRFGGDAPGLVPGGVYMTWHSAEVGEEIHDLSSIGLGFENPLLESVRQSEGKPPSVSMIYTTISREYLFDHVYKIYPLPAEEGMRGAVFYVQLNTRREEVVELGGNLYEAGAYIQLDVDPRRNGDFVSYLLPPEAKRDDEGRVTGGTWICALMRRGGKHYSVIFMAHHYSYKKEPPVFGARDDGLFGIHFEVWAHPQILWLEKYRILWSSGWLDLETCLDLYENHPAR